VPLVVRWPGEIRGGSTSDHIGYFGDFMATAAELADVPAPKQLDSISFLPTLLGETERQQQHDYLYWEFYGQGGKRAVRMGRWKGVRPKWHGPLELYDLQQDLGESNNLASQQPEVVERIAQFMEEAHITSTHWKVPQSARSK